MADALPEGEHPLVAEASPEERAWLAEHVGPGGDGSAGGTGGAEARTRPTAERLAVTDRAVLLLARRGEVLTTAGVATTLELSEHKARSALQRLRDRGLLTQEGHLRGTTFVLTDGLAPLAGPRLAHQQLRKVVLTMAVRGGVTNEQVRERTGLGRLDALRLLGELVEEGRLVRRGSRRGTYYSLG